MRAKVATSTSTIPSSGTSTSMQEFAMSRTVDAAMHAASVPTRSRMNTDQGHGAVPDAERRHLRVGYSSLQNVPTTIRGVLAHLGLLKFKKALVQQLGVQSVSDFSWLNAANLIEIGMPVQKREIFLAYVADRLPIYADRHKVDPSLRLFPGDGAVM